jgi:uncharacterized membrane protein YhiD involved in acid resistance
MQQPISAFPPTEIATKLLLSLGIGLLVGFEREWSHKDLGVRTFAITSLLGMLAALIAPTFILAAFGGIVALVILVNASGVQAQKALEITTSAALLVTFSLGVLIGQGHFFTPAASAIVMTLLHALKPRLLRFVGGLTQEEVRELGRRQRFRFSIFGRKIEAISNTTLRSFPSCRKDLVCRVAVDNPIASSRQAYIANNIGWLVKTRRHRNPFWI